MRKSQGAFIQLVFMLNFDEERQICYCNACPVAGKRKAKNLQILLCYNLRKYLVLKEVKQRAILYTSATKKK